jgi:hypothetical protein
LGLGDIGAVKAPRVVAPSRCARFDEREGQLRPQLFQTPGNQAICEATANKHQIEHFVTA